MREVRFHIFLQWLAERQLAAAQARGPVLGLYRDLALGVARDSGEVWARPDLFAASVSIGAPPDPFSAAGQNWQLPPFIPQALKRSGHAPVAEILRANMRAAGALRIDHVLGYARQFWIPAGAAGIDGAYVTYPADDLVALTALESTRARCLVIGEDLGTVPEGLRQRLAAAGILSYKVLWFERGADGAFLPPSSYPHLSAACLSSHDLVPFLGWTAAREPAGRRQLEAALERESIPSGATDADLMVAAHRMIARAPSTLMLVQADDLAGETEPLNVPGTDRERPNWRRRLKVTVEALAAEPLARRTIGAVAEERSGTASATAPRA